MKRKREESLLEGLAKNLLLAAAVIIGVSVLQPILYQASGHPGQIQTWPVFLFGSILLIIAAVLLLVDNWMKARERRDVSDEIG